MPKKKKTFNPSSRKNRSKEEEIEDLKEAAVVSKLKLELARAEATTKEYYKKLRFERKWHNKTLKLILLFGIAIGILVGILIGGVLI